MSLRSRILPLNDEVTIPGTIVCVQCAAHRQVDQVNPRRKILRLRCGVATSGRMEDGKWTREKSLSFQTSSDLWPWINFVRQSQKPCWLFSHGLSGALSLLEFWRLMESSEFALHKRPTADLAKIKSERVRRKLSRTIPGLLVETDPPTGILCYHKTGWKLVALDLRNYWDKSMRQLAGLVNRELSPEPSEDAPVANWLAWCSDRAAVAVECVTRLAGWHKKQQLGRFGWTVAGIALAGFRHRFMTHPVATPVNQDDRDFERTGYFNGRTEALWLGESNFGRYTPPAGRSADPTLFSTCPRPPYHLVDARSFYGAVAAFSEVPVQCVAEGDGKPRGEFYPYRLGPEFMASVLIDSDQEEFPVRVAGRIVYAVGRFWTVLCGPELLRAVQANCVKAVGHWREYRLEPALQAFALSMWSERKAAEAAGDLLMAGLVKGLLARLHGKFLQRATRWQHLPKRVAPMAFGQWFELNATTGMMERFRSVGWDVQVEVPAGDAPHCFPALAAYVTSYGREWLRHWIKLAGHRNVLYVSTDSLIVTDEGRKKLETAGIIYGDGVGSCRVVESASSVAIFGQNHFQIGSKVSVPGVPAASDARPASVHRVVTRPGLRQILHGNLWKSPVVETTAEYTVSPQQTQRLTAGGWLERITLSEQESRWTGTPIESFADAT